MSTINMKHIKRNFRAKACVSPPGWTWGVGSKGQYSTFSDHGDVVCQSKGNHECSGMIAVFYSQTPTHTQPLILTLVRVKKIQNKH